jgi:hypothetical protein
MAMMLEVVADAYDPLITPSRRDMIRRTTDVASAFATSTLDDDELTALLSEWERFFDDPGSEILDDGCWTLMIACYAVVAEIVDGKGRRGAADPIFRAAAELPADLFAVPNPGLFRIPLDRDIDEAKPAGRLVARLLEIAQG